MKDLYPPVGKSGRRGVGNHNDVGKPPAPTSAKIGSEEKVAVMAARAEAGEALFSEEDSRAIDPRLQPKSDERKIHVEFLDAVLKGRRRRRRR